MAQFLYKLGLAAHDNRKKFLVTWLAILAIVGLLAGLFMGKLSNTFTLPGTETERVLELMDQEIPELSGGTGTIVFQSQDGQPLTAEQHTAITAALDEISGQEPVRSVIDPFVMQQQLEDGRKELEEGRTAIAENEKKLADGKKELEDGAQQLLDAEQEIASGEKEIAKNEDKLTDGRAQLEAGKEELARAQEKLDSAKRQLDAGAAELAAGRAKLAEGEEQYAAGQKQIASGEQQLAAAQKELAAGKKEYEAGKAKFDAGVEELTSGLGVADLADVPQAISDNQNSITQGVEQAQAGKKAAQDGIAAANANITSLNAAIADLEDTKATLEDAGQTGTPEYAQVVSSLADARDALAQAQAGKTRAEEGLAAANAVLTQLASAQAQLDAASDGYVELSSNAPGLEKAGAEIAAGEKRLAQESAKLEAGKNELRAAATQLADARTQVAAGAKELESGRAQYESGLAQAQAGADEIAKNEKVLTDGEQQLAKGKEELAEGKQLIEENKAKLDDARAQIADGEQQLEDGKKGLESGERTLALTNKMKFVNDAGDTAIAQVMFYEQAESLTSEQRADITAVSGDLEDAGVKTLFSKEIVSDLNSIFGITEILGLVLAGVILLIMLGTFVAAGLPLLMAVLGVALGVGGTLAFSSLVDMQSITPALALMLGLAVGIDYSLFIVHRHRTQLLAGMDMRQSIGRAIGTSGNAVVFAGLTVIIALAALVVSGLPFIAILGVSAAFTVLVSVLLSITLTPAILAMIGEKLLPKKGRAKRAAAIAAGTGGASIAAAAGARKSPSLWWVQTLTKKPWLTAIASIAVLGALAIPAASMRTALPDGGSEPFGSDAQQAYEITSREFGPGYNGQLIALVEMPDSVVSKADADLKNVELAELLNEIDGVHAAIPAVTNDDATFGAIQIIPETGPADPETEALMHVLRDQAPDLEAATDTTMSITGQIAAQIDVSEKISAALPPYLAIVVGLSLILLLLVFRSVVVPLIATGGFLLSLAASFGATVAVYQWGWLGPIFDIHNPAPIMSFLPILLTGILFGLAMDYQVFLVTAMREAYAHGSSPRRAVKEGFNLAAPVVVAAALIMIAVFASFIFAHLTMIRPIGFALAFGVLFDAFIVRMTLTPAVMHLLGEKAWYLPKWLNKILPDVDVEGANLKADNAPEEAPKEPVLASA